MIEDPIDVTLVIQIEANVEYFEIISLSRIGQFGLWHAERHIVVVHAAAPR